MTPLQPGESFIGDTLAKWTAVQRVDPSRIVFGTDDRGSASITMTVRNGDVLPGMPNNRAQLVKTDLYAEGGSYLLAGARHRIRKCPTTFPKGGWFEGDQKAYGKPNGGSPSWRTITMDGRNYGLRYGDGPMLWTHPIVIDEWWNTAVWMTMGRARAPFVFAAWRDGERPMARVVVRDDLTLIPSMKDGPWGFYLDAYMAAGTADEIVIEHVPPTITRTA